jgi:hypothetical protein
MTLIAADDRATLSIGNPQRYALGDPAAPVLVLNDADSFGCMWAAEEPDGWTAPTVSTPIDRRQDGHGGYAGEPTFEPRVLTVNGTVSAPTVADLFAAQARFLDAVLGSIPDYVRYTHLDEDPARGLWVLPGSGKPLWRALDDRIAEFSVILLAEDPIKTGPALTYGPVHLPSATGDGGYAMGASGATAPWTASGGSSGLVTSVTVPNVGDQDSQAIYTVTGGAVPRPVLQFGTGAYVALNLDLGAGDTLAVDTAAGTVTVNGVNRYDAWGAGSTFPLIPARTGTTMQLRSATGGNDPSARLTALTAPSWK